MRPFLLAIDGPAGAGKSTIARAVAARLGLRHVDSGAMYRAVAWVAAREGVSLSDERALLAAVAGVRLDPSPGGFRVDGALVEEEIRTSAAGQAASAVALHPRLRERLVELQRSFLRPPGLVMEGRDIGTVVFPRADLKLFVTATPEARARRRYEELHQRGEEADPAAIEEAVRERDRQDTERTASPLLPAPDAVPLDTTSLTVEEQIELAAEWADRARRPPRCMHPIFALGRFAAAAFARVVLSFRVEGLERIPRRGSLLVACNHISFWDPPLVGSSIPRETHFVAKAELFENRLFGALIRRYNSIPIRRGPQARAGLRGAEDVLQSGGVVLVFPEGTRSKTGEFLPPRPGIAHLAWAARSPVVPAYISGSNQIRRSMARRNRIRITFGSPMMPPILAEGDREGERAYARRIMEAIDSLRTRQERNCGRDRSR